MFQCKMADCQEYRGEKIHIERFCSQSEIGRTSLREAEWHFKQYDYERHKSGERKSQEKKRRKKEEENLKGTQ